MRTRIPLLLAVLLIALLPAASPAQAADPAAAKRPVAAGVGTSRPDATTDAGGPCGPRGCPSWILRTRQYLSGNPIESMPTSCISGRRQLAAGHYDWFHFVRDSNDDLIYGFKLWDDLYLGAGGYGMETCLDPRSGGFYTQTTTLYPDNPAWHPVQIRENFRLFGSREYSWGASLDPQF